MSERTLLETIIYLIIMVVVLVIVIFAFLYVKLPQTIDNIFPSFKQTVKEVKWEQEFFLTHPEFIEYEFADGTWKQNLFYHYDPGLGWQWTNGKEMLPSGKEKRWFSVSNKEIIVYKKLDAIDKLFIDSLSEKSAEEGLKLLVEQTLANKGEGLMVVASALKARIGTWTGVYSYTDRILGDLDNLIDKFNQISYGVAKQK